MVAIQNTLVSDEVFTECFCCDLQKCKGCCCIEGDAGAPLEKEEVALLAKYYPLYKDYMTQEGREVVERPLVSGSILPDLVDARDAANKTFYEVFPLDNSLLTPLVNQRDCAYLTPPDEVGIVYCAIEKAYRDGKIPFRKPVSCALYPIRVQHYPEYDALNYSRWDICRAAERLGKRKGIPVFRFLEGPLTEVYGKEWFQEAEAAYKAIFSLHLQK